MDLVQHQKFGFGKVLDDTQSSSVLRAKKKSVLGTTLTVITLSELNTHRMVTPCGMGQVAIAHWKHFLAFVGHFN